MATREEMEETLKALLNEGLDLSDKIMKSENTAVIMAAVCILEDFFQKEKPVELAIMKKVVGEIRKDIDTSRKGSYDA